MVDIGYAAPILARLVNNGSFFLWTFLSLFSTVVVFNRRDHLLPYVASLPILTETLFIILPHARQSPANPKTGRGKFD